LPGRLSCPEKRELSFTGDISGIIDEEIFQLSSFLLQEELSFSQRLPFCRQSTEFLCFLFFLPSASQTDISLLLFFFAFQLEPCLTDILQVSQVTYT